MERLGKERIDEIRKFNRFYTNILEQVNKGALASSYSLPEVSVMLEIDAAGQCTASELTRRLDIDPGYLSRMIERFKSESLITETRSTDDQRNQVLALTDTGRAAFRELSAASSRQISALLDRLPNSDQAALVAHMAAIRAILTDDGTGAQPVIRASRPGDGGYIAYLHGIVYARDYDIGPVYEENVLKTMGEFAADRAGDKLWVAESRGCIIGSIGITAQDQENAMLRCLLLEPEFRGYGLGRRLLATALDYCRDQKFRRVFLLTFDGQEVARHLYRDSGFLVTEQFIDNSLANRPLNVERWELTLAQA